ncbi:uncharacterized protein LOC119683895 [Teleopsis dalmanni]|uniref:uncharacterized protein LOC119678822 n=1 Tax=Teleopsis dalmanni TaxID=139649 RepID=UPI0018CEC853|nr:uncharacterized protein LOC119678822 [Teleopsis dalmanni]XP_037953697.1 uncharacterized protein LOC119683895 [Teleopsis dalmanni]
MGASNRNTRIAVGLSAFSFLLFFIAFVSPYWLVTDGTLRAPRFTNLGLWEVCFNNFTDIHRFYDTVFTGCMWVFEEEYYIIHDFLLPGFYIAVQFFATLCFVMCLITLPLTLAFLRTSRDDDRYVVLLLTKGSCQILGSLFGFIAVVIFGAKGDSRDWMPGWQTNDMGWAFAFAVVGAVMLLPAGILYIVEARRERYKRLNEISNRDVSEYGGQEEVYQQQAQQYFAPESSRPRRPQPGQRAAPATIEPSAPGPSGGIQTDI